MTNGVRQTGLAPFVTPDAVTQALPLSRVGDPSAEALTDRQRSFAGVLSRAAQHPGAPTDPQAIARESAEQLVAISFLQPLLKQFRDSNHAAPPFAPTQAEKQMQGLFDAQLAQHLTRAQNWPLVDVIAQRLLTQPADQAGKDR